MDFKTVKKSKKRGFFFKKNLSFLCKKFQKDLEKTILCIIFVETKQSRKNIDIANVIHWFLIVNFIIGYIALFFQKKRKEITKKEFILGLVCWSILLVVHFCNLETVLSV